MASEAQRRDTPGEGMPAVQHVSEADDHFVVTFADGKSTTVLKDGLRPDTLAHIQGMAHGGLVIAGGTGVRVESEGSSPGDEPTPRAGNAAPSPSAPRHPPIFPVIIRPGATEYEGPEPSEKPKQGENATARGEEIPQMAHGGEVTDAGSTIFAPLDFMGGGMDAGSVSPPSGPVQFWPGNLAPAVDPLLPNVSPEAVAATQAVDKASPYGLPSSSAVGPGPQRGMVDLRGAEALTPKPSASAAPPSGLPTPPSGSGALAELNKGVAEQRAGLAAQVEVEKARDAALLQLQDKHIAQMQALEAQQAEAMAAHQRRADDLFQATLNAKIDPNRVWANADIGQKIGAGIGIILSGIGVGLAGGPNLALQVIDRTIDRDIDAQKANLENQKGLLSYYLQQGRDMLSAHALAKADLKDMLAAQVTRVSAEFGGAEAAARAQMIGGQLRTEAAGKRQEILAREFQMQTQRAALGAEMERNRLVSTFMGMMGKPGGGGPGAEQVWEMMPKDVRERRVRLPNGGWGLAKDPTQASDLAKGFQALDEFRSGLRRYQTLKDTGSPKLPSTIFGGDSAAAEEEYGFLTAKLKDMQKLGALSESDYALIFKQIPDISSWRTGWNTAEQKLAGLEAALNAAVASQLKTLGLL